MKSTLRTTGIVAGITLLAVSSAHAQVTLGGGGGGMGMFGPLIDYFRANMIMGILYMAIAGVFITMMCAHFRLQTALLVAGGAVGLINTPSIAAALASMAGG